MAVHHWMNPDEYITALRRLLAEREWSWKEGNKVYCENCGAEHRDTTIKRNHRENCEFVRLYRNTKTL